MKVERTKNVQGIERIPSSTDSPKAPPAPPAPEDRVSVGEERKLDDLVRTTRSRASSVRASKLEQIEAAVAKGSYRPDAGRIADQILAAAEIDARLRAMMSKG
jgi:flagellar biosynthesis anti-sigma factor FlgM